ncbi:MAG TPA: hypothetical protein VHW95_00070 [Steroidobacteraceae bacterium]|nr:hypothetical protein [Steroidobacteraceae bacterium]
MTNKYDFRPSLLYGSTTESMIPWEWLANSGETAPSLTERERVDMLLRAVNGDWLSVPEWTRMCGAPLNTVLPPSSPEAKELSKFWAAHSNPESGTNSRSWEDQRVPLMDQARESLYAALSAVISEPETAVPEIAKNVAGILDRRVIRVTELSEHGVLRDRIIAHSPGAALVFALGLILDPEKPYRRRLRQCALPVCSRFAIGVPPETRGQPPNFYCPETTHSDDHRKQRNKERAAASRAGVPVEKYRKRKMRRRSS